MIKRIMIMAAMAAALVMSAPTFAQVRTKTDIANDLRRLADEVESISNSAELTTALMMGGDIHLRDGVEYPGNFVVTKPTRMIGLGKSTLTGSTSGPALRVLASHVYLSGFRATTANPDSVLVIGTGTETAVEATPEDVTLDHVVVDNYRGKRGLAIHGRNIRVTQSTFTNIWTLTGQDSQAVWIGNAPCAPCIIDQNDLSAGSEILMVGGSIMAIPGVHPTDIRITRNHLFRPESWRTDGVSRAIKNILELKDGQDVVISDNNMEGSWVNGQDGPAIVITSKSGGNVQRVTVERNDITRAGYGFQMLAADYHIDSPPTPALLSGVVIRDNYVSVSKAMGWTGADGVFHGSRGILALVMGGIRDVTINNNTAITDGAVFVEADSRGNYVGLDGLLHPNPAIGRLSITNNFLVSGIYGLRINGAQGGLQPLVPGVDVLEFTGNTVADATATLQRTFPPPTNTYLTRAEWDAIAK